MSDSHWAVGWTGEGVQDAAAGSEGGGSLHWHRTAQQKDMAIGRLQAGRGNKEESARGCIAWAWEWL